MLKAHPDTEAVAVAYVFIVEFRAKPDEVEPCAELIDRHAHNSRTLEEGCPAFDVCQGPQNSAGVVSYEAYRDQAAHGQHFEMDSYGWFRAKAPDLLVPGVQELVAPAPRGADAPPVAFRIARPGQQ